jgi:hypothetical protein
MARRLIASVFVLIAALTASAGAQTLADPTRPSGVADAAGDASAQNNSGLQSIIRPATGKPRALINGEIVQVGDKIGEARLVSIGVDSVVLLNADGSRDVLSVTPGVVKVNKSTARPSSSARR